ncbi:hypothetical protein COCCU_05430 [Corynebacterium occultum]|uniref:Uncharacterized protein n=1 Tax=Corynebacterium occultum TaxID=2675219 RepID=A0A6B8VND2_9CORY|nr:hypothetical protein [Corynebacterium occultum]QGU07032.1 hypothetical protein COCCU_05430 [Corynebacterium occultum]
MPTSSSQRGIVAALVVLIIVLLVILAATITFVLRSQPGGTRSAEETVVTVTAPMSAETEPPTEPGPSTAVEDPSAAEQSEISAGQTQIRYISPVNRAGQLQAGWQISESESLDTWCGDSPVAVDEGIYSCGPSALSAPVCFAAADGIFYCPLGPFGNEIRALDLTFELHDSTTGEPGPWALKLDDGRTCTVRTGGAWGFRNDDYVGSYSCDRGPEVVLVSQSGDDAFGVDRSGEKWTVKLGELGISGETFPPPSTVGVNTAYFAAWAE